jgi:Family of unknown function (DUF6152)
MWNQRPRRAAIVLGLTCAGAVGNAVPAAAHHSFALFDMTKSVMLEGTVKRFEWTNPHSWIFLDVIGPQNVNEEWTIELPAAGALAREGWTPNYLAAGERIIVRINPLRDGKKGGSLESFTPGSPRNRTR